MREGRQGKRQKREQRLQPTYTNLQELKAREVGNTTRRDTTRWFRGRVYCALDYEAGDPGSIPGSGGTTNWLFSAGW